MGLCHKKDINYKNNKKLESLKSIHRVLYYSLRANESKEASLKSSKWLNLESLAFPLSVKIIWDNLMHF